MNYERRTVRAYLTPRECHWVDDVQPRLIALAETAEADGDLGERDVLLGLLIDYRAELDRVVRQRMGVSR